VVVTTPATAQALEHALRDACVAAFGDSRLRIDGLRRLSGGASRQTWSFDVVAGDGARTACILRRDPPGARRRAVGMTDEAALLRLARGAGVPAPEVLMNGDGAGSLGTPFMVMRRIEGETIPRRILREESLKHGRELLTAQCAQALARIHVISVGDLPTLSHSHPLVEYRTILVPIAAGYPSDEAMDVACRLAAERRATIVAMTVIEVPLELPLDAYLPAAVTSANEQLDEARAIGESYGVNVITRLVRARNAGRAVVDEAARRHAEIIVMGGPRRIRLQAGRRAIFGDTVDFVLKHAPCRVMVAAGRAAA